MPPVTVPSPVERTHRVAVAAVYDPVVGLADRWFLDRWRARLADGLTGRILDLGAGTGRMHPHLAATEGVTEVHAVEPDPAMRRRGRRRSQRHGLDVQWHGAAGEALPFREGTFDAAIASLVLCTVTDEAAVRAELARVIASGGELRFLEHVRGDGLRGRAQRAIQPLWRPVAAGCHLTRRQHEGYLADPAFEALEVEPIDAGIFPIRPFVFGRFRRR